MIKGKKQFILPVVVGVMELILFYIVSSYFYNNNLFYSINIVNWDNILVKLADDYITMLFIPTIIIILNRKNLKDFNLCLESKNEIYFLILVMVAFFVLHNDFTIIGFYKFFFYLVVVSFGEEFIFRGFVYNKLKIKSEVSAIILSGMLWGIAHAI